MSYTPDGAFLCTISYLRFSSFLGSLKMGRREAFLCFPHSTHSQTFSFLHQDSKCSQLLVWSISHSGSSCCCSLGKFEDSSVYSCKGTSSGSLHSPLLGHVSLEAGSLTLRLPLLVSPLFGGGHIFMISSGPCLANQSWHVLVKCVGNRARVVAHAGKACLDIDVPVSFGAGVLLAVPGCQCLWQLTSRCHRGTTDICRYRNI